MSIRPVNSVLAEKARVELNEDPERVQGDIQHLKEWIAKQPHLRARTDDQWLLLFLRGSKFSSEKAKQKLDLFYTLRTAVPELSKYKHTDSKFSEIFSLGAMFILPNTWGPDTPVVSIFRPGVCDPNKHSLIDIMAAASIIHQVFHDLYENIKVREFRKENMTELQFYGARSKIILTDSDNIAIAGIHNIVDLEGASIAHLLNMTPLEIKKMIAATQDSLPIRMKGIHYLNTLPGFETILNVLKFGLNEKNKSRIFVHNKNYEEMYKHIPKDILPVEYGGNGGTIPEILEYWRKKMDQYSSWLEEDEKFGVDESKRPGKPKTETDLFGIDGSFRQLQFD